MPALIILGALACDMQEAAPDAAGAWRGSVVFPGVTATIQVHFRRTDRELAGLFDVPGTRSFGLVLQDVSQSDSRVRFSLPASGRRMLHFSGTLEGSVLKGSIRAEGVEGEFRVLRGKHDELVTAVESRIAWPASGRKSWPTESWPLSTPSAEDMDSEQMATAVRTLAGDAPELRALLVVKNGRLVFERYYGGANADTPLNTKSVCKSIIGALVGIAVDQGLLRNSAQPVREVLPAYFEVLDDPRKRDLKLSHLLTMTAGLEWVENGPITTQWAASDDYVRFALSLRMLSNPGDEFTYNSSLCDMLGAAVAIASESSLTVFASKFLFSPIGARIGRWEKVPGGMEFGGSELYLTARDIARFGFLFLNRGRWEERQIVPAAWVDESVAVHADGDPFLGRYGFLWWLGQEGTHSTFFASGAHGQIVYVVPDLDLLIVVCCSTDSSLHHVRSYMAGFVGAVQW